MKCTDCKKPVEDHYIELDYLRFCRQCADAYLRHHNNANIEKKQRQIDLFSRNSYET